MVIGEVFKGSINGAIVSLLGQFRSLVGYLLGNSDNVYTVNPNLNDLKIEYRSFSSLGLNNQGYVNSRVMIPVMLSFKGDIAKYTTVFRTDSGKYLDEARLALDEAIVEIKQLIHVRGGYTRELLKKPIIFPTPVDYSGFYNGSAKDSIPLHVAFPKYSDIDLAARNLVLCGDTYSVKNLEWFIAQYKTIDEMYKHMVEHNGDDEVSQVVTDRLVNYFENSAVLLTHVSNTYGTYNILTLATITAIREVMK